MAHETAGTLLSGDMEHLPRGIAILALLDGGWWFMGRHYHAGCPLHGSRGAGRCRREGILRTIDGGRDSLGSP